VDGELVAFDADGRPDLRLLLRRHGLTDAWRLRQARHWCRVRYVLARHRPSRRPNLTGLIARRLATEQKRTQGIPDHHTDTQAD
jgi:hypothetical protein